MKKIIGSIVAIIAGLLLFLFTGPGVTVDETIRPYSIGRDPDRYLENSESRYDIKPENEKKIFWAHPDRHRTGRAIICIHGYSASRKELSPVVENVAQKLGANLYFTRLSGHGLKNSDRFADATVNDFFNDMAESYAIGEKLGDSIIIVAVSTGVPLAVWFVDRFKEKAKKISALVCISANFRPANPASELLVLPRGRALAGIFLGEYYGWEPKNDLQRRFWTYRYPSRSVVTMMALVAHARRAVYEDIKIPSLFIYTEHDKAVSVDRIIEVYDKFSSRKKKLVNLKEAKEHVLAGDAYSPETTSRVTGLITAFLNE